MLVESRIRVEPLMEGSNLLTVLFKQISLVCFLSDLLIDFLYFLSLFVSCPSTFSDLSQSHVQFLDVIF